MDKVKGILRQDREDRSVSWARLKSPYINQLFTFVGEDEERIRKVAQLVDEEIKGVVKEHGIVNTLNAVVMAMMKIADDYMSMRERFEKVDDKTLRLLRKVERR